MIEFKAVKLKSLLHFQHRASKSSSCPLHLLSGWAELYSFKEPFIRHATAIITANFYLCVTGAVFNNAENQMFSLFCRCLQYPHRLWSLKFKDWCTTNTWIFLIVCKVQLCSRNDNDSYYFYLLLLERWVLTWNEASELIWPIVCDSKNSGEDFRCVRNNEVVVYLQSIVGIKDILAVHQAVDVSVIKHMTFWWQGRLSYL